MKIHFIGIGGTAMGSVAVAAQNQGHHVSGSDDGVYPPMSTMLHDAGIDWIDGYHARNVVANKPDLVIIGNAISRGNPELEAVLNNRIPFSSMAEFVGNELIGTHTSIVCTGTHGKTTTSSMAAWILEYAKREPGFIIGGALPWHDSGCRAPKAAESSQIGVFVCEGDEYDTAFFDKRSKFLHYKPNVLIVNNIEFDHADIFASIEDIKRSFRHLVRIVPQNGVVYVNANDSLAREVVQQTHTPVVSVGTSDDADIAIRRISESNEKTGFDLFEGNAKIGSFQIPMAGTHNVRNAAMAICATRFVGVPTPTIQSALEVLPLPKRRLETIGTWRGCTVIDDFAHHPTAIQATIQALHQMFPGKHIHAVFEPRSNTTTRSFFQKELTECWKGATSVCLGPINRPERYAESDRLNTQQICESLISEGIQSVAISGTADATNWGLSALPFLESVVQQNDVIALLSNGNVGGLRTLLTSDAN